MAFGLDGMFKKRANVPAAEKGPKLNIEEFTEPVSGATVRIIEKDDETELWLNGRIERSSNSNPGVVGSMPTVSAFFKPEEASEARALYEKIKSALVAEAAKPGDPDHIFDTVAELFPEEEHSIGV